jgi:hypothetical protein
MMASDKLAIGIPELAGTATFVTQSRAKERPCTHEICNYSAELLGWGFAILPASFLSLVGMLVKIGYTMQKLVMPPSMIRGTPPHAFMTFQNYEQTFDNSKARRVLGFEPQHTWQEDVELIISEYKQTNPGKIEAVSSAIEPKRVRTP